jgi:undecaprenyl-diphosphatase
MDRELPRDQDRLAPDRHLIQTLRRPLTRTAPSERLWLLGIAVAALIPYILLAIWAHNVSAGVFEQDLVNALAVQQNLSGDLVRGLNALGNPLNWVIFTLAIAVVVGFLRGGYAGLFVGATYLVDFVVDITKAWVERERPDTIAAHVLFGVDSFGFPSGHTARAAALAGALLWVFVPARWRLPAAVVGAALGGLAMAYARIALGVHFPTDTLGGLLIGIAWMAATATLL